MPRKNFKDLEKKMGPERLARVRQRTTQLLAEMPLHELRTAQKRTQEQLASVLGVNQASISKMERRADMYVSTLASYIGAMGGKLDIVARFPGGDVRITQFRLEDEEDDELTAATVG